MKLALHVVLNLLQQARASRDWQRLAWEREGREEMEWELVREDCEEAGEEDPETEIEDRRPRADPTLRCRREEVSVVG